MSRTRDWSFVEGGPRDALSRQWDALSPPNSARGLGGGGSSYNPLTALGTLGALWDFSVGVTPVSGEVDSIADQTGRGNTLTAPAAINRPVYTVSDADFNGNGTGTGDGTNDGIRKAAISMGGAFGPGTVILVCKSVVATAGDTYMSMNLGSTMIRENSVAGVLETLQGTGVRVTSTAFLTRAHVIAMVADGANIQQYVDGVAQGATAAYTGTTADGSPIGLFSRSDNPVISSANVKIAFAAISLTALTAAQMAAFGAYSRTRFGTP